MKRNPERQGPVRSRRAADAPKPDAPTAEPQMDSPQRASAKAQKRGLVKEARRLQEKNWLAPAGSEREKIFLRKLAEQAGLSDEDRTLIKNWLKNPNAPIDHNRPFWRAAKELVLGRVIHSIAMERHKKLRNEEWLVAYFTVQGIKQQKIAEEIHVGDRTVDGIIRTLKDKIVRELNYKVGDEQGNLDRAEIVRWFFGQ